MNKLPRQVSVSTDWPTARTQLMRILELHASGVNLVNIGWEEYAFPAHTLNPASGAVPPAVDTVTYPGTLLFSGAATQSIGGLTHLPHSWGEGSNVVPHIHWSKTTADGLGDDVGWQLRIISSNLGTPIGAYGGWDGHSLVTGDLTTQENHNLSSFPEIDMTGMVMSAKILWELRRDVSIDTYAADARLLGVNFYYELDTNGSRAMYTK